VFFSGCWYWKADVKAMTSCLWDHSFSRCRKDDVWCEWFHWLVTEAASDCAVL